MAYSKAYTRIIWVNKSDGTQTPLGASLLNRMDNALNEVDNRTVELDTTKLDKDTALTMVQDISWDAATGTIIIKYLNGKTTKIDTKLEKLAVNFSFDEETQKLVIMLDDGTKQEVDLSSFITQYEFTDSDTVTFTLDGTKVTASVKEGSIKEKHLQPNYLADIKVESAKAQTSAEAAAVSEQNAKDSETAAANSETNAQYYAEQAKKVSGVPTKVSELENDSGYATDEELKKTTELAALNKQTLGYGKKNLLKVTATTKTSAGVTFTVNNDGSVTANGTATASPTSITISGDIGLEKGKSYILSGSPNNPNCSIKIATKVNGLRGVPYVQTTGGERILFTYDGTLIDSIDVVVRNVGTTVNNLTFYPMIRSADIEDDTYEPYVDDVDTRLDKIDNSILDTLEEISANTDPNMIAGALALKEINGKINRDFYGTNGYSPSIDLMPNNDVSAPLSRLGSCYISNPELVSTCHAPETGFAFAFGESVNRYAIIFIGFTKVWYRITNSDWKEL